MRYKIFKNCEENVRWKERKTERERESRKAISFSIQIFFFGNKL